MLGESPGGGFFLVVSTEISEGFLGSFISALFHPSSPSDFQQKEGIPRKRWRSIEMVDSSLLLWTLTGHLRDGLSQAT